MHDHFIGLKFTNVRDELSSYRNHIAHPFIDDKYFDFDTYELQADLVVITNMLERMAIQIIEQEIIALATVDEENRFDEVKNMYIED